MKIYSGRKEYVNCNLCKGEESCQILEYKIGTEKFGFVRCKKCDLIYANPRPAESDIKEFMAEEYYASKDLDAWDVNRRKGFQSRLKLLNKYCNNNKGKLLDIGCGSGGFMKAAQADGWSVEGVEPSKSACDVARVKCGLKVINSNLKEANFKNSYFDAITLCDVVCLMRDPLGELQEVNRLLKQSGVVALRIMPVYNPLFSSIWKIMINIFGINEDWLYIFSPKTIKCYLEKSGFGKIKIYNAIPTKRPENSRFRNIVRGSIYTGAKIGYVLSRGSLILGSSVEVLATKL